MKDKYKRDYESVVQDQINPILHKSRKVLAILRNFKICNQDSTSCCYGLIK